MPTAVGALVFATSLRLQCASFAGGLETSVKGLRFERLGTGRHYNVILHIGSTYVPVTDETLESLKEQSLLPTDRFLELVLEKVGYSSYLKEQILAELKRGGDTNTQITVLQGVIRDL